MESIWGTRMKPHQYSLILLMLCFNLVFSCPEWVPIALPCFLVMFYSIILSLELFVEHLGTKNAKDE